MSSKFGEIIGKAKQARQPDGQAKVKPNNQIASKPDNESRDQPNKVEKMVNLCVKVPKSLRQHWAAEAKRHDITMTEIIIEALNQKFGKP